MPLLAGLTSAGTAGVYSFFAHAEEAERGRAEAQDGALRVSWLVLPRIVTEKDVPQESSLIGPRTNRN